MSTAHAYSMTELWTAHTSMALWKVSLIVLFFLLCGLVLCLAHWCMLRGYIMEYGYPRLKAKTLKKRLKSDPFPQKLCMLRLCRDAQRKGWFLRLCLLMNFVNIASVPVAVVGAVGAVITHTDGWAMCLLFAPFDCLVVSAALLFIPGLVFLPSERRRYQRK